MSGNIYIDIDDVISDSTRDFHHVVNKNFNKSCTFEDMTSFDLKKSFGLTSREYERFMEIVHSPKVIRSNRPVKDAQKSLSALKSAYDIIVVTGRPVSAYEDSRYWLQKNEIPFKELYFVDKYSRYDCSAERPYLKTFPELAEFGFKYAVEDSFDTSLRLARMGIPVALLDRPWNRFPLAADSPEAGLITRCSGWNEVTRLII